MNPYREKAEMPIYIDPLPWYRSEWMFVPGVLLAIAAVFCFFWFALVYCVNT